MLSLLCVESGFHYFANSKKRSLQRNAPSEQKHMSHPRKQLNRQWKRNGNESEIERQQVVRVKKLLTGRRTRKRKRNTRKWMHQIRSSFAGLLTSSLQYVILIPRRTMIFQVTDGTHIYWFSAFGDPFQASWS